MERREFITTLGAVAAAAPASSALGKKAGKMAAPVHHMHPPPVQGGIGSTAAKCVLEGNNCLRHCFGMLSMNNFEHGGMHQGLFRRDRGLRRA